MSRVYSVSFENIAVTAAQDLICITGASSSKITRIISCNVGATNTTLPTAQMLEIRCRLLGATVSAGTGGNSFTPIKLDQGDSAASSTGYINATGKATTSGTAYVLFEDAAHIFAGHSITFPSRPIVSNGEAFVYELLSTVSGTVNMSGSVYFEEIGG